MGGRVPTPTPGVVELGEQDRPKRGDDLQSDVHLGESEAKTQGRGSYPGGGMPTVEAVSSALDT